MIAISTSYSRSFKKAQNTISCITLKSLITDSINKHEYQTTQSETECNFQDILNRASDFGNWDKSTKPNIHTRAVIVLLSYGQVLLQI